MKSKKIVDAYGQQLWSYFKTGKPKHEIIERNDGLISVGEKYGAETYFSDYKNWDDLDKKAIKYAQGRILDIGCGAGRHSLYLQKHGFMVTGIDNSPLSIKIAKQRGLKRAFVRSIDDIGAFKADSFDSIIMLGNNFGLFGSYRKAKLLLRRLHLITSRNALIIAESRDPYGTKNPIHLAYQKKNRGHGRMSGQLRIRVRYNNLIGNWFDYLLASKKEVKKILEGTGWKMEKFIDGRNGAFVALIQKS